jgi:hypothetical protein
MKGAVMARKKSKLHDVVATVEDRNNLRDILKGWISDEFGEKCLGDGGWEHDFAIYSLPSRNTGSRICFTIVSRRSYYSSPENSKYLIKLEVTDSNWKTHKKRMTVGYEINGWGKRHFLNKIKTLLPIQQERQLYDEIKEEERQKRNEEIEERRAYVNGINTLIQNGTFEGKLSQCSSELRISVNGDRKLINELLEKIYGKEELALLEIG